MSTHHEPDGTCIGVAKFWLESNPTIEGKTGHIYLCRECARTWGGLGYKMQGLAAGQPCICKWARCNAHQQELAEGQP